MERFIKVVAILVAVVQIFAGYGCVTSALRKIWVYVQLDKPNIGIDLSICFSLTLATLAFHIAFTLLNKVVSNK